MRRAEQFNDTMKPFKIIPAANLTCHDILLGRGNAVSSNEGNQNYRAIIWKYRDEYISAERHKKHEIAMKVIDDVYAQNPPGRFIERHTEDTYQEVSNARILEKCCQSLREKKYKSRASTAPPLLLKRSSSMSQKRKAVVRKTKSVVSFDKTTAKHKPPAKAAPRKKLVKTKTAVKARALIPGTEQPEQVAPSSPHNESEEKEPEITVAVATKVPIIDKTSFINAKKLLLGNKVQAVTNPPPLEQPSSFQVIEETAESMEASENDVFDGMFNMLPLSLVEFYSGQSQSQASDGKTSREKTREEAIESPTTVVDDLAFIQPVPLQMTHSLYLEGESKWVNPTDNVTANVVATWTEFATNGCFAKYG